MGCRMGRKCVYVYVCVHLHVRAFVCKCMRLGAGVLHTWTSVYHSGIRAVRIPNFISSFLVFKPKLPGLVIRIGRQLPQVV